jgi:hypothetical protein
VQRALAHEAERRGVPERGGPAVAEHDLVALGHAEQLAQARADAADERLDRLLPVRGAHQRGAVALDEARQLGGTDLRRAAAEAAVAGLEVLGDGQGGVSSGHVAPRLDRVESAQARDRTTLVAPRWFST